MTNARFEAGLDRRTLLGATAAGAAALGTALAASAQPSSLPGPWTRTGFVDRGVGRIHYAVLGEGEPVVLMHKLGGWLADWRTIAPLLAQGRQIIALDLPGHGDSTMVGPAPTVWSPAESAALVKFALAEIGVPRFSIVGNSLGGCIGVVLAARWPESVKSLALLSVALASAMTQEEVLAQDASIRSQYGPNWEPLPRSSEQTSTFGSISPRINEEQNMSRPKAGRWVRACERGVGLAGMDAHLSMIAAPTLIMFADRGPYTRFEPVARERIRNLRVEKLQNVGSFFHQEKPAETAAVLNTFLPKA